MIIAGPTLNFDAELFSQLAPDVNTPIMLMSEYDFASFQMEDLSAGLKVLGYENCIEMPTGLSGVNQGVFIDRLASEFDLSNTSQLTALFDSGLTKTSAQLLEGKSASDYIESTHIAVSYSHNNAERFLTVHALLATTDKNTDVIMMGEECAGEKNDKPVLTALAPSLLEKGFGQVIYQELGKDPVIIAATGNGGPVYRIVHTGRVDGIEAENLRKIGGAFSGATGDQSYSEAIASSHLIVYECQSWKRDFVRGMNDIANIVDSGGRLSSAIELLSSASNHHEYQELATLLSDPKVQDDFKQYREIILSNKNLTHHFQEQLAVMESKVVENHAKKSEAHPAMDSPAAESKTSFFRRMLALFRASEPAKQIQHQTEETTTKKSGPGY